MDLRATLPYLKIARLDHWFKNVFVLPGIAVALVIEPAPIHLEPLLIISGFLAIGCIVSANYTINEYLDAEFDSVHPLKRHRPGARGQLKGRNVLVQYLVLSAGGLALAWTVGKDFAEVAFALLVMGMIYNVHPIRSKDRVYIDVLTESINNPLRFLLGWFMITHGIFPPSSILLSYWMGGAFLMAVKRHAEYRSIADAAIAASYRRSFRFYTADTLILSAFFYALTSAFFLGIFLVKYRIEFIFAFPLFALLFVWYLYLGMKPNSATQTPEHLYRESYFIAYVCFVAAAVVLLLFVDIPWLTFLLEPVGSR